MTDEQIRTDDIRQDVLNALYTRRTGAHEATTIRTVFLAGRGYTLEEVETSLADLERLGMARHDFIGLSSAVKAWQITGPGLTHKERGGH